MSFVFQVFGHKPKFWTKLDFELMKALGEKSGDLTYYNSSSGDCECVHQTSTNPTKACRNISIKN